MTSFDCTWLSFHKNYPVVCRPALPKDTPDVLELTRTIWEGDDYVPRVWKEWLEDYEGLLAVAELGDQVVGTGKLTRLSAWDWWLEGLRVHPEFQGRGIASQLHDYILNYWLRTAQGTLRLGTASFRLSVQHMAERSGFRKVVEFSSYAAPALEGESFQFEKIVSGELNEALQFSYNSQTFELCHHLMDLGWQWTSANKVYFTAAIQKESAWWWQGRRGLLVTGEDRESQVPQQIISVAACPLADLPDMLREYRSLVGKAGFNQAEWSAPLHDQLTPLLDQAGFSREWEEAVFIYDLQHPQKPSPSSAPIP
jgi:GNAT superfamily N-acetyltransferase